MARSALDPNGGMLLAHDLRAASAWMDDPPTSRYGRHIEGSGVHHHPTPGPADGKWLYGHNWVALAWLATHPVGGHRAATTSGGRRAEAFGTVQLGISHVTSLCGPFGSRTGMNWTIEISILLRLGPAPHIWNTDNSLNSSLPRDP